MRLGTRAPTDANTARLTYFDPTAPPRVLAASPPYAEVHLRSEVQVRRGRDLPRSRVRLACSSADLPPPAVRGAQVQGSNLSPPEGADNLLCRFGDAEV